MGLLLQTLALCRCLVPMAAPVLRHNPSVCTVVVRVLAVVLLCACFLVPAFERLMMRASHAGMVAA